MVNHTPHGKIRNSAFPIDVEGIRKDSIEWLSHHGEVGSVLHQLQRGGVQAEVGSHVKVQSQPRKTPETLHPITQPTQQHHLPVPNILPLFLLVPLLNHHAPRHHRQCGPLIDGATGGVAVVKETNHTWQRKFCAMFLESWHVPHQWVLGRNSVNHGFGDSEFNFPMKRNNGYCSCLFSCQMVVKKPTPTQNIKNQTLKEKKEKLSHLWFPHDYCRNERVNKRKEVNGYPLFHDGVEQKMGMVKERIYTREERRGRDLEECIVGFFLKKIKFLLFIMWVLFDSEKVEEGSRFKIWLEVTV